MLALSRKKVDYCCLVQDAVCVKDEQHKAHSHDNGANNPCPHTLRAGYNEGWAGFATSQMHSSPSAAPDASKLGLKLLNSRPFTCKHRTQLSCCRLGPSTATAAATAPLHLGHHYLPCPSAWTAWKAEGSGRNPRPVELGSRGRCSRLTGLQQ